ncbi:MAG: hypothetical protein ACRDFA_00045 [bacterium]
MNGRWQPPDDSGRRLFSRANAALDELIELLAAKQYGARIVGPPTDQPFGERPYAAEDHAGHPWTFSQHIADLAPEDWGATSAKAK